MTFVLPLFLVLVSFALFYPKKKKRVKLVLHQGGKSKTFKEK